MARIKNDSLGKATATTTAYLEVVGKAPAADTGNFGSYAGADARFGRRHVSHVGRQGRIQHIQWPIQTL
ncbi:hypothetical protein [Nonomuraea sp. NPDC048901]|uniref:hypothetical protein n=1 Tax=Nonomuraea sp. NPDC048901 TaxID=3155627 RepID=UPI0033FCB12F